MTEHEDAAPEREDAAPKREDAAQQRKDSRQKHDVQMDTFSRRRLREKVFIDEGDSR